MWLGSEIALVRLFRVCECHLCDPDRSVRLIDAVPYPPAAGQLVLPLGEFVSPHLAGRKLAFELMCPSRVVTAIGRPLDEPLPLGCQKFRFCNTRCVPLLSSRR